MLKFNLSKIQNSYEADVANGATITAEGSALVRDIAGGGVKPSTGAANEQFVGVSLSQQLTPLALPKTEQLVATSVGNGSITLAYTPLASTLRIQKRAANGTLSDLALTTDYTISGNVVSFVASQVGLTMFAFYKFAPTTVQVKAIQGDIPAGGAPGSLLSKVGVINQGEIFTTEFDTTVDWSTVTQAVPVKLGANGIFTIGGAGGSIPGATVTNVPRAGNDFLGIRFSV